MSDSGGGGRLVVGEGASRSPWLAAGLNLLAWGAGYLCLRRGLGVLLLPLWFISLSLCASDFHPFHGGDLLTLP